MFWIVLAISIALVFIAFWMCGGREYLGDQLNRLFPDAPMQKGEKVSVFLNGKYNRTATISGVSANKLFLYDNRLELSIDYRGKFYAVGVDSKDGSRVVYVANGKHFRFVRVAELIRKIFNVLDSQENLIADEAVVPTDQDKQDESEEDSGDEV